MEGYEGVTSVAASAAARISATGAGSAVHCSNASAAWCTSMPRPSTACAPGGTRRGEQRRLQRLVHEVDHDLTRMQRGRRRAATIESPSIPIGVALTTMSAAAAASPRAVPVDRGRHVAVDLAPAREPGDGVGGRALAARVTRHLAPGLAQRDRDARAPRRRRRAAAPIAAGDVDASVGELSA